MSYVADAYLEGRSDEHPSPRVDQFRPAARNRRIRRLRPRRREDTEGLSWLYNFIKAQGERNYGKIYVPSPDVDAGVPGRAGRTDRQRRSRETSCHAEDGDRGVLADPAGHAGQRDGVSVGTATDHPWRRADSGPASPHVAGLAGLSGAQAEPDDQQRVAVTHRRRRGRTGRAVQWPPGHVHRRCGTSRFGGSHPNRSTRPRSIATRSSTHSSKPRDRRDGARYGRTVPTEISWSVVESGDEAAGPVEVRPSSQKNCRFQRAHRRGDGLEWRLGVTRRGRRLDAASGR